jgi:aldose 1-epimerase
VPFGTLADGRGIDRIALAAGDLSVSLLTYGAILQDLRLKGTDHSLTLGSELLADYQGQMRYHGSLIGPVANRISTARARIAGMVYELERNEDGRLHLHSGAQGLHAQVWEIESHDESSVTLAVSLPDGTCGLPGNRRIRARFQVSAPASMTMTVTATSDAKTLMNIANHSYWNLDGTERWDGHSLRIIADHYLASTADDYPTGEICEVDQTLMDFREVRDIAVNTPPFDTNFCLSDSRQPLRDVLWLRGTSGIGMTLATTEPGVQVYDGRNALRPGRQPYEGLAIEAQFWPDATNNPAFPSIMLEAGADWEQVTRWSFDRLAPVVA